MFCTNQFGNMVEKGHTWWDWDAIYSDNQFIFIYICSIQNTRLQLSKNVGHDPHKTSTHVRTALINSMKPANILNFFKKVAKYREFITLYANPIISPNYFYLSLVKLWHLSSPNVAKWRHRCHTFAKKGTFLTYPINTNP